MTHPFSNPQVAWTFDQYPQPVRERLLALRELIFETAVSIEGVGAIEETLKWNQPSYLTPQTKSGSTIRIDQVKGTSDQYALYFHCQTNLVATFREIYRDELEFEGNRAIILDSTQPIPAEALRDCIAMALTYHLRKKQKGETFTI